MNISDIKTREDCEKADELNPLRAFREKFLVPEGTIYFMGNSLGLCPRVILDTVSSLIVNDWGTLGIEGYSKLNWFHYPKLIGEKLGKLIGAESGETIVLESTSTSIFKCLAASIQIQKIDKPTCRVIMLERDNFPTDNYIAEGLLNLISSDDYEIRYFDDENPLEKMINSETVLVLLSAVNYRTGYLHNMKMVTSMAHSVNAHIIWDLSHATGAIPIDLNKIEADFAVGCTYKYLNSGPGAPSFVWVNKKHHDRILQPISGWYSHSTPFKMDYKYSPAKGIQQFATGSPNIISMASISSSLDIFFQTDMQIVRKVSLQLGDLLIKLLEEKCPSLILVTPKDHDMRGSHLSFKHENGLNISKQLRECKIICDYRNPQILRFAITPLYMRFIDIWDSVAKITFAVKNASKEIAIDVNEVT